jgi:hypothetical protein
MGLLDDAIRQHLELRRLHGADPSEVASKEHEALGPAAAWGEGVPPTEPGPTCTAAPPALAATGEPWSARRAVRWEDAWGAGEPQPHLSQETVELDMRELLAEDGRIARATPDELPAMASSAPARSHR